MKNRLLLLLLVLSAGWAGCNVINPSEQTPTYVQVDSFAFKPPIDPIKTAGYTHDITSCWAYMDGKVLGVFDLPAKIPVLASQPGSFQVGPGIISNGMKNYLLQYPFYTSDTFTLNPQPGKIVPFTPKTSYVSDAMFVWREDFEGGNDLATRISGDTDLVRTNAPGVKLDGGYSGYIYMKAPQSQMEAISTSTFSASGTNVFMEIDYRSSMPFLVGLQSVSGNAYQYILGVNPRDQRSKIYISLASFFGLYPSTDGYRVQIEAQLPAGQSEGYVTIDNLKIITFQQ